MFDKTLVLRSSQSATIIEIRESETQEIIKKAKINSRVPKDSSYGEGRLNLLPSL